MKIRTDFVTNSSSSSYVTVIFKMKDGTQIESKSPMDDIGHGIDPAPLSELDDEELLQMLQGVNSGKELFDVFDKHYRGMYIVQKPQNDSGALQEIYDEFNYETVSDISFDAVEEIVINDICRGDYGKTEKTFRYNPKSKTCDSEAEGNTDPNIEMMYENDMSPEEIADCLGKDVEEVIRELILAKADEMDPEELAEVFGKNVEEVMEILESEEGFDE